MTATLDMNLSVQDLADLIDALQIQMEQGEDDEDHMNRLDDLSTRLSHELRRRTHDRFARPSY